VHRDAGVVARKTGAVAVPQPQVASAPALQWVMTSTGPFLRLAMSRRKLEPVHADRMFDRYVFRCDGVRFAPRGVGARSLGKVSDRTPYAIERPAQIDRGWPRRVEPGVRARECAVAGIAIERERQTVSADGADQRAPRTHISRIASAAESASAIFVVTRRWGVHADR
jgi:hypothetical protein